MRIELSVISWWVSDIFWRIYGHGISCCTFPPSTSHHLNIVEASRTELHQSRGQSLHVGMVHGWIQNLKIRGLWIHWQDFTYTLGPCLFDLNQIHKVRCWEWSPDLILFNRLITVSILDQGTQLGVLDFCLVEKKVPDRSCGFAKKLKQWVLRSWKRPLLAGKPWTKSRLFI